MFEINFKKKFPLLGCALLFSSLGAIAEETNWPCVQRKVETIAAVTVWQGTDLEKIDRALLQNDEILERARRISLKSIDSKERKMIIQEFGEKSVAKNDRLSALFILSLEIFNRQRQVTLRNIEKFDRMQKKLMLKIGEFQDALGQPVGDESEAERSDLQIKYEWHLNIFSERENSLRYLCERPVIYEKRIFEISREISNNLDATKSTF